MNTSSSQPDNTIDSDDIDQIAFDFMEMFWGTPREFAYKHLKIILAQEATTAKQQLFVQVKAARVEELRKVHGGANDWGIKHNGYSARDIHISEVFGYIDDRVAELTKEQE